MIAPSRKMLLLAGCLAGSAFLAPAQPVVINEIMFHPYHPVGTPEPQLEEYVELLNTAPTNVNLSGWSLSGGADFAFATNTMLGPGRYLVVAANRTVFGAKYPGVTNVTGDWIGKLNDHDGNVNLKNAAGTVVNSVHYSDEGDWAVRRRGPDDLGKRGWKWYSPADGLGSSEELMNPAMPNQYGQNWAASAVNNGTPGRANSVTNSNSAPFILDVAHFPAVPRSSDSVAVTARIVDESVPTVTVTLRFRVDAVTPNSFTVMNMFDDGMHGDGVMGDGIFGAILPAQANNTVIEFYVQAMDTLGNTRTWPGPAIAAADGTGPTGQVANCLYQVDDNSQNAYGGTPVLMPVYKLIMTANEAAELRGIPCSGSQNSDAEMNGTFISMDGTETLVRYACGFRNRGHGSRCASPPNYRVNFQSDNRWKGVRAVNINSQNVPAQVMGAALCLKSGLAGANSRAVNIRVNNENRMGSANSGAYACNEELDGDFAALRFPNDPNGNVYRAIRDIAPPDFNYRGTDDVDYQNTYFKTTNESEDDWTDLIGMLDVMGIGNTQPFTPDNVRRVINVEQWMLHLAIMSLYANNETGLNSGYNDDYFMYHGVNDPRFILMYYDQDSIMGISSGGTGESIFNNTTSNGSGAAIGRFVQDPNYAPIYYATFRKLLDTTFAQAEFNAFVDQTLAAWAPGAASSIKSWMVSRRASVESQIACCVPPVTNVPIAILSGEPRSPTPFTTASLTVGGANVTHYRFKLNNGAYGAETPVATPIALSGLANGSTNVVQVIGRNSAGIYQAATSATTSRVWVVNTSVPKVRLNELLARNDSAVNHNGTFPDVIELYNEGTGAVDLTGMRLTDDPANPGKFTFPATTTLAAGAYLVVYANNVDGTPGLHTGFTLDQEGEALYLYDKVSSGGALLDSVVFGVQLANLSIGRLSGSGDWSLTQPTFGAANVAQPTGSQAGLKINEWLASGQAPFLDDYIEIYNTASLPVALGGCFLTDEPIGAPAQSRIAPLSFIGGNGFQTFLADGGSGATHVNFQLASEQGQIGLRAPDLTVIDNVVYVPQRSGVSFGRCPDASVTITAMSLPTPGSPNLCPTPPPPLQLTNLLPVSSTWRYLQGGNLDGVNWTAPGYDDSAWPSGQALLGVISSGSVPEPIRTPLTIGGGRITYYFRSSFTVPANFSASSLQFSNVIDDGAVFYLNGTEVARYNMPSGTILNATTTQNLSGPPPWTGPIQISTNRIVPGAINTIAVEVHNSSSTSADVVMGTRLDGVIVTAFASAAGIVINEIAANNPPGSQNGGQASDWVEFYNPSSNAVDLAGLSLGTSPATNGVRWTFPSPSILPAQGYLTVTFDGDLLPSTTNTGFGLSKSGDGVYLFNKASAGGAVLDFVNFGLQIEQFTIGRSPNGSTNWVLCTPTYGTANVTALLGDPSNLKVNEWMADPAGGQDWFEIYNPNPQPVAVGNFYLTDDFSTPSGRLKSRIPALSFLGVATNAFQKFIADQPGTYQGADHVAFKLSASGESVGLSGPSGALIDGWTFGAQQTGVSQGRLPDGTTKIVSFPGTASPGEANYLLLTNMVVNEVLSHTDLPLEDAVEFQNISATSVDISGWWLSDSEDFLKKYLIPATPAIPPGGFKVFYEYEFNPDAMLNQSFSFSSSKGDQVYLSQATAGGVLTGYRAVARFGPSANGVSFGRYVNSVGTVDYPAMSALSLGTAVTAQSPTNQNPLFRTGQGAANPYPKVGPVIISEIMYHPPDTIYGSTTNDNVIEEFIELENTSGSTVPLYDPASPTNGWRLRDAVDFTFAFGNSIPPGGHVLVVSFDPYTNAAALAQFQERYGSNLTLFGPYDGKLDNGSDSVELVKPDSPQLDGSVPYVLVEKVVYQDSGDWPAAADGFGMSLQRVSSTGYANDPTNWFAALPTPAPSGVMDSDGDGMPDDWEMANGLNKNNPADAGLDPDGDGLTNLQEYLAGTDPHSAASTLRLAALLNGATVDLSFTAVAGKTYTILHAPTMPAGGGWTRLTDIPPQGATGLVTVQDGSVVGGTQRFYRVITPAMP